MELRRNCVPASKSLEQSAGLRRGFGGSRQAKNVAGVQVCCQNLTNLRDVGKASDEPACENKGTLMATRRPFPPFPRETAIEKVRLAEDGWNTGEAEKSSASLRA